MAQTITIKTKISTVRTGNRDAKATRGPRSDKTIADATSLARVP